MLHLLGVVIAFAWHSVIVLQALIVPHMLLHHATSYLGMNARLKTDLEMESMAWKLPKGLSCALSAYEA